MGGGGGGEADVRKGSGKEFAAGSAVTTGG